MRSRDKVPTIDRAPWQSLRRLFLAANLLIWCGSFYGCASVAVQGNRLAIRDQEIQWIRPNGFEKPKAIVVVLHGLNLKPSKMDGWAHMLAGHGAMVARLELHGHQEGADMALASSAQWCQEFHEQMAVVQKKSAELGVPMYFLGFSLGAVVGLHWLAEDNGADAGFAKVALIAPAIAVPWYAKAAVGLFSLFGQGYYLPSRSPERYRAHKGTSIAAYRALFEVRDALERSKYKNNNIPALVVIDRYDELVPANAIRKTIQTYRLSQWLLEIVDNKFAYDNFGFRHLLVDEESMGQDLWQDLCKRVLTHFGLI